MQPAAACVLSEVASRGGSLLALLVGIWRFKTPGMSAATRHAIVKQKRHAGLWYHAGLYNAGL